MKKLLIILALLNLVAVARSADWLKSDRFGLYGVAGANLYSAQPLRGKLFEGVGVSYKLSESVRWTAETAVQDWNGHALDQVGTHFKGYLPLFKTGLFGYGEIGYQHHFAARGDYMSSGAGVEVRGKRASLGFGARVLEDFRTGAKVQPVAYLGWRF